MKISLPTGIIPNVNFIANVQQLLQLGPCRNRNARYTTKDYNITIRRYRFRLRNKLFALHSMQITDQLDTNYGKTVDKLHHRPLPAIGQNNQNDRPTQSRN